MRTGMCTIWIFWSTSRSGSPMSRIVTSHPPHMVNHSSARRAAMLHLPVRTLTPHPAGGGRATTPLTPLVHAIRTRAQLLDLVHHVRNNLGKTRTFGSGDPFQAKAFGLEPEIFQHQRDGVRARLG